jgi:hypothetical protein
MFVQQLFSLITFSFLMNNTHNNQGNHCITGINLDPTRPAETPGNLILSGNNEYCQNILGLLLGANIYETASYTVEEA